MKVVDFFENRAKYTNQGKSDDFLNAVKDIAEFIKDPKVKFQYYFKLNF